MCGQFWRQRKSILQKEDKNILFGWKKIEATRRPRQETYFRYRHPHPCRRWFVSFLWFYLTPFPDLNHPQLCNPTVICSFFLAQRICNPNIENVWFLWDSPQKLKHWVYLRKRSYLLAITLIASKGCSRSDYKVGRIKFFGYCCWNPSFVDFHFALGSVCGK